MKSLSCCDEDSCPNRIFKILSHADNSQFCHTTRYGTIWYQHTIFNHCRTYRLFFVPLRVLAPFLPLFLFGLPTIPTAPSRHGRLPFGTLKNPVWWCGRVRGMVLVVGVWWWWCHTTIWYGTTIPYLSGRR